MSLEKMMACRFRLENSRLNKLYVYFPFLSTQYCDDAAANGRDLVHDDPGDTSSDVDTWGLGYANIIDHCHRANNNVSLSPSV